MITGMNVDVNAATALSKTLVVGSFTVYVLALIVVGVAGAMLVHAVFRRGVAGEDTATPAE